MDGHRSMVLPQVTRAAGLLELGGGWRLGQPSDSPAGVPDPAGHGLRA